MAADSDPVSKGQTQSTIAPQTTDEPLLSESELDEYIISIPDLTKKRHRPAKKKNFSHLDRSGRSTPSNSPAKSQTSSISEADGVQKVPGWFGTDARVWSKGFVSPTKN